MAVRESHRNWANKRVINKKKTTVKSIESLSCSRLFHGSSVTVNNFIYFLFPIQRFSWSYLFCGVHGFSMVSILDAPVFPGIR